MPLLAIDCDLIAMDDGTYMWIQVTHFAIPNELGDRELLHSLVESPGFAYDYASPFNCDAVVTEPAVHGRWWRSAIRAESFEPCAVADAESALQAWADDQDWTDPSFRQSDAVQVRLQDIFTLLTAGALYRLVNPGVDDEHEYGFVTGQLGFNEFVVIDRSAGRVHLVVASDD